MKHPKKSALFLSAIFGLLSIASDCNASLIATVSPASQTVAVGASPSVSILLSNSPGTINAVAGYQFDLSFDPAVLQAQSVTEQGFFAANGVFFFSGMVNNTAGVITFIADASSGAQTENPSPADTLVSVVFQAAGPGTSTVGVRNPVFLDGFGTVIPATTVDGQITVTSAGTVPEPSTWIFLSGGLAVFVTMRSKRAARQQAV